MRGVGEDRVALMSTRLGGVELWRKGGVKAGSGGVVTPGPREEPR